VTFELSIILFVVASLLDVVSTNKLLSKGGRELNPVIAFIMKHTGKHWWIGKVALNGLALGLILYLGIHWVLWIGAAAMLLIAINNFRIASNL